MKIKIDKNGYLWLERAGKMKQAWCPNGSHRDKIYVGDRFQTYFSYSPCGDWRATFREDDTYWDDKVDKHITVCGIEHSCFIKDFTDERGGE